MSRCIVWEVKIPPPYNANKRNFIHLYVYINPAGKYSYWLDYVLCRGQGSWVNWEESSFDTLSEATTGAFEYAEYVFYQLLSTVYHTDKIMVGQLFANNSIASISLLLLN